MPRHLVAALVVLGLCTGTWAAAPVAGWTPASQVEIAREAAELAPPDLRRQLVRHLESLAQGARAPFEGTAAEQHYRNRDGAGTVDRTIASEVAAAIEALRAPRPFAEVVWRLGVISHYVADANHPLNAADDDPEEGRYFADYARYMQSAEPRFALVFYAAEPPVESERDVRLLALRALARGRQLYPLLGEEYRRIGFATGVGRFDDRSTAFGVAAVSFSHAVSDMARLLRYVWLQSGGADDRREMWAQQNRLLLLPRARGSR
ncbi:MAG TPA: hypothetical protein VMT16_13010 [Thermoanaerobaculia bacterium]|nr:hypothetical protein [Thermoanaerobaculia bacterium]